MAIPDMTSILVLTGLALLAVGGEMLVRGAVGAARVLRVSPLLVGLTIVGFGTSTPELVTSVYAALENAPGIAIGNVVGSNIANILLVLGLSGLAAPLMTQKRAYRRDGLALAASTAACLAAVLMGVIDQRVGASLVVLLIAYIGWAYWNERQAPARDFTVHEQVAVAAAPSTRSLTLSLVMVAVGIATTVLGARLLVDGAVSLARAWGASETLIGLTIVAIGTSLPELVACVVAAIRRQPDVAIGNAIGSCIYNALGILGITAIIHPIQVPPEIIRLDIWVLVGATILALKFLRSDWTLKRWEGGLLILLYGAYLSYLFLTA